MQNDFINKHAKRLDRALQAVGEVPVRLFIKDLNGRIIAANERTCSVHGVKTVESLRRLGPSENLRIFDERYTKLIRSEDQQVIETDVPILFRFDREQLATGAIQDVCVTKLPINDHDGNRIGILGFAIPLDELHASNGPVDLSMNIWSIAGAGDGLWCRDLRDRDSLWTSPRWKEMLGYDPNELQTSRSWWRSQIHPDDVELVESAIDEHFAHPTDRYCCNYRMCSKTGNWIWIRARGSLVMDLANGEPIRFAGSHTDITEEINLARKQKEDVNLLREAINSVTDSFVFVKDSNQRFRWVNEALADALGSDPHKIRGCSDREVGIPEFQAREFEADDKAILDGQPRIERSERLRLASGEIRQIFTVKQPYIDSDGRRFIVGVSTNIGSLQAVNDELKRSKQLLQTVLDNTGEAIYLKDVTVEPSIFRLVNRRMADIVGLKDPDEAIGQTHHQLFGDHAPHATSAIEHESEIKVTHQSGAKKSWVSRDTGLGGQPGKSWCSITQRTPIIENGKVMQIVAVARDTTTLESDRETFEQLLNSINQVVWMKDENLEFKWWSTSFENYHRQAIGSEKFELWKKSRETGRPLNDLTLWVHDLAAAESYRENDLEILNSGLRGEPVVESQHWWDGTERFVKTSKWAVKDPSGDGSNIGVMGFFEDVTHEHEERKRELEKRVQEIYSDLARQLGHNISTFMGILEGHCSRLTHQDQSISETAQQELLHGIRALKHFADLARLSARLSLSTSDERLDFKSIPLRQLGKYIDCHPAVSLAIRDQDKEVSIEVSELYMQLAIAEMVMNAIRFTQRCESPRILVEIGITGELAEIRVTDNGPGVRNDLKQDIFAPRFTTNPGLHTGIGLHCVHRIAELHGGNVREQGVADNGADFVLQWPVVPS